MGRSAGGRVKDRPRRKTREEGRQEVGAKVQSTGAMGGLPRIRLLTHPFGTRCAGFEPFKAVRFRTTNACLYQFSAIGPISNSFHKPGTHRILIHVDSLFDGVFKATNAMMKRSGLPPAIGVL